LIVTRNSATPLEPTRTIVVDAETVFPVRDPDGVTLTCRAALEKVP
jgi:hypothetical protein